LDGEEITLLQWSYMTMGWREDSPSAIELLDNEKERR
jgi:hypothetical protein